MVGVGRAGAASLLSTMSGHTARGTASTQKLRRLAGEREPGRHGPGVET